MAVEAILQLEQSAITPGPGISMIGVGGLPVTLTSTSNVGVVKYTFTMLDAPLDSGFVTPLVLGSGSSPTATFTPDLPETPGCYRLELALVYANGCQRSTIRNFAIPTPQGWLLPSFKSKASELNFPGWTEGWQEMLNRIFLDLAAGGLDELVKVSAGDTLSSYLASKILAGTNITTSIVNPGLNEQLRIDSTGGGGTPTGTYIDGGVAVGDLVSVVGADTAVPASAASTASSVVGFATSVSGGIAVVQYVGEVVGFTGLAPGSQYWCGVVPGSILAAPPSGSGIIRRKVATAKNPTTLVVNVDPNFLVLA